jgi:lysophospholipase L1-like esterase
MAMKPKIRIGTMAAVGAAAIAITTVVAVTPSIAATGPAPVSAGARYLALGDSVPFGYRESTAVQAPNYMKPNTFVGYPELIANNLDLKLTNASCPGETTTAMIDVTAQDNGCQTQVNGDPGYRAAYPLHTDYGSPSTSQLDFAISFLKAHPGTKLVTLQIGANDGFVCQETTADHCTSPSELSAVLGAIGKHVGRIVRNIRNKAGYSGQLVVVNYYSVQSASNDANAQSLAINSALQGATSQYDVTIADAYTQFTKASKNAPGTANGGDTCVAGLLTFQTESTQNENCGVHPSLAGQALIATAVERVVSKS